MSSTTESSHGDEAEWLDVEPDEEQLTFVSLFDNESFPDLKSMMAHCKKVNNFDLAATIKSLGLEFHGAVKLVNFVRSLVKEQQPVPEAISATDFDDDKYLQPVLENDAVLFSLDDILDENSPELDAQNASAEKSGEKSGQRNSKELEAELASIKEQFNNYRLAVERTLDKRWGDDDDNLKKSTIAATKDNSNYYFESYAENEIHETMLKDKVRTDAYRDFIYENKHIFKGKTVLDIGCGTGILSMFCAKAGAEKVIAVDKSAIMEKARENVFNNGLSDKITCLRGAIEDVTLPVDSVDIIVSEWMGYCLLYEAMLPSVLYARDKYLKPDGLLVPSSGTIWLAPVEDPEFVSDHVEYWNDVYGFNMKAMQEGIYDEVRIQTTPGSTVCGDAFPFKVLDLHTIKVEDLSFSAQWSSMLNRPVERLDGFLIWFDNFFATSRSEPVPDAHTTPAMWNKKGRGNIAFTTGPFDPETHWRQGLLLQPSAALKSTENSVKLTGNITFSALEENARALKIDLSWAVENEQAQNRSWNLK